MPINDEIELAISAHISWKQRLATAVHTGKCHNLTPENADNSHLDAFGKWVDHRLDDKYKESPLFKEIWARHEKFHHESSEILRLALEGNHIEASQRMTAQSEFTRDSNELITLMREWQEFG